MREDMARDGVFARACSGPKWTSRRKRKRSVPASLVAVWILMMDAKAETPRQPDSWVRCLGWQNLEFTAESLSAAVVSTLVALSMPYTVVESAGQLGMTFVVYPIEPDARELMPMTDDLMPSAELISERLGLRVSIHIFAADAENAGKHNVNLRRTTGNHWRFQAVYTAFRREFSSQIGLPDEAALSLYSPMQPRRDIAENSAPAAGWTCGTFSRGLPGSEKPPQLVGYELRRSGVTDFLGAMRVDSHHHHEQQQRHHHQHPQAADTTSGLRYTSKRPWVLGGLPSPFS